MYTILNMMKISLALSFLLVLASCSSAPKDQISYDKEDVRKTVQDNIKELKGCYEVALEEHPKTYGKVVLQWTINDKGTVSEAHVKSSTINEKDFENCLVKRLMTWKFPETPEGQNAVITYPFVFSSKDN